MSRPRRIKALAQRFLVWRYVKSVRGSCTYRDISIHTGVPVSTVNDICQRYGYEVTAETNLNHGDMLMPVDSFIAIKDSRVRNMCR